EVLPQIRKTGKYEVQSQQLALPEPDLNLTAIQNSEETLALIIQLYSYCFQAHEMQEKLQNTSIAKLMENQIGGQYLYNFKQNRPHFIVWRFSAPKIQHYPSNLFFSIHCLITGKKYKQQRTKRIIEQIFAI
ncbi:hypothetical protein M8948_11520, partial [Pasteurella multocida]|nr:hypothetical protein [Pasteurella multocida]